MCSRHSKKLGKIVYGCHRKWLQPTHPWRSNAHDFHGKFERKVALLVMKGFDVLDHANAYEMWKLNGGKEDDNACVRIGVKRKNILFDLPYWKVLGLEPHLEI
jgi:hypothetical protein